LVAILQSFGTSFGTILVAILQSFGISFGTASVAMSALVRHGSGSFDLSLSPGAFAGILDVHCMLGELIVSDRGVRSLALLRVCLLIHR